MNDAILQAIVNGLAFGSLTGLIAAGHTLLYREFKTLCLPFSVVPSLAALLATGSAASVTASFPGMPTIFHLAAALVVGWIGAVLVLYLYERFFWKDLRRASRVDQLIAGLVVMVTVAALVTLVLESGQLPFPTGFEPAPMTGGVYLSQVHLVVVGTSILLTYACAHYFLPEQDYGGHNEKRRLMALTLAGLLGSAAGLGYCLIYGATPPLNHSDLRVTALIAALIGGLGRVLASAAAGLALGVLTALFATYSGDITSGWLGSQYADTLMPLGVLVFWYCLPYMQARLHVTHAGDAPAATGMTVRPGQSAAAVVVVGLAGLCSLLFSPSNIAAGLVRNMPMLVSAVGLYCAVSRARVPALGFMTYSIVGAYLYALLESDQLLAWSHPEWLALSRTVSPWVALLGIAGLGGLLAGTVYMFTARVSTDAFAIASLATFLTAQIFIQNMGDPLLPPDSAVGIRAVQEIKLGNDLVQGISHTVSGQLPIFLAGLAVLAGAVSLLALLDLDGSTRRAWYYALAGALGAAGGALLAGTQGFISPGDFHLFDAVGPFAGVLLLKRLGLAGIIVGLSALVLVQNWWPWSPSTIPLFCAVMLYAYRVMFKNTSEHASGVATPFGPLPYRR